MPNDDYIKRDDALKVLCDKCVFESRCSRENEFCNQIQGIKAITAADVEGKRMEGIWIEQPESLNDRRDKIYRCSICGYGDEQSPSAEVPYCWHCGSKMKREVK